MSSVLEPTLTQAGRPEVPPLAWTTEAPLQTPQAMLMQMMIGHWISQPVYVVAKLGVADLLADGPRSVEELAAATQSDASSLYRVLRATAAVGIFAELEDGRFDTTPTGQLLRRDVPGSLRGWALWSGDEWHWRAWGGLLDAVRTGETAFDSVWGQDIWSYLAENREAADTFNRAMSGNALQQQGAIIPAYDFSSFGVLIDVAGGEGHLLGAILTANPHLEGVLFDQPAVVARAGRHPRMRTVGGDFFAAVPSGGDAYLLTAILHDWDDERARVLLRNCRQAMGPGATLLAVEMVVPEGNAFGFAKFTDIEQLTCFAGWERTEAQYRELFAEAGFALRRTVPTAGPVSLLEAVPV